MTPLPLNERIAVIENDVKHLVKSVEDFRESFSEHSKKEDANYQGIIDMFKNTINDHKEYVESRLEEQDEKFVTKDEYKSVTVILWILRNIGYILALAIGLTILINNVPGLEKILEIIK